MSTVCGNVRRRVEFAIERGEARSQRARLRRPAPDGPFGPTTGFSPDAIRLATLEYTYLEQAEVVGDVAGRRHIRAETIRLRRDPSNQRYMRRRGDTGRGTVHTRRRCAIPSRPVLNSDAFAGSPPRCVVGWKGGWRRIGDGNSNEGRSNVFYLSMIYLKSYLRLKFLVAIWLLAETGSGIFAGGVSGRNCCFRIKGGYRPAFPPPSFAHGTVDNNLVRKYPGWLV